MRVRVAEQSKKVLLTKPSVHPAVEGRPRPSDPVLNLQVTHGNRWVQRLLEGNTLRNALPRIPAIGVLDRVLQRQRTGTSRPRQATPAEQAELARDAVQFLQSAAEFYRGNPRLRADVLRRALEGWRSTLTGTRPLVAGDAARSRELTQAYRDAVNAIITAAAPQLNQTVHELFQEHRGIIDESAWPSATASATGSELSDALPEAERRRIRVVTTSVHVPGLAALFSTQGGTTTIPLPPGVTVRYDSGVRREMQHGLSNVAGSIIPDPLEVNSTITLSLDVGGEFAAYRFTYVEHGRGRTRTTEVLIERLGTIGVEGLPPSEVAGNQRKFDNHGFHRGSGWSTANFEALLSALAQVPDAHLTPVDGLRFNREAAHPTDARRGGDYNAETHTITMYDRAFGSGLVRFGTPGAGVSTDAVQAISHEIGHAVDLQPLRAAWASLEQASAARNAAFAQYEDPPGSRNYRFPASEQASWNQLSAAIRTAEQRRDRARSASGSRWQAGAGGVFETVEGGRAAGSNAFRQAAMRDGGARVTHYSDTNWGEYFAESYSLYITAEDTLRRLRPHVYAYFTANFPQ